MRHFMTLILILLLMIISFNGFAHAEEATIDFENRNRTFDPLTQIKTRPDMVILVPNGGVVFVFRDKYGTIIGEEYYSVRVRDQGIGICDDVGKDDTWLFTGGGLLLHKEDAFPVGLKPYWRYQKQDQSFLHNERSTIPRR